MTQPAREGFPPDHPLRDDRDRLEKVLDLMWWEILRVLHQPRRKRGRPGQPELTLVGGASADDILQDALIGLLRYEPDSVTNWEGLGVRIAKNKAIAAIRKSRAYRTRDDEADIEIASLDFEGPDGKPVVETIPSNRNRNTTEDDALVEVERLEQQVALFAALRVLDDREAAIVARIQRGETREAISEDYDVSRVRIGQIYASALKKLGKALSEDGWLDAGGL